jgi:hypothetical protein
MARGFCILMYKKSRSQFNGIIRIRTTQLLWLKKNKTTKTLAGFLDIILNDWKQIYDRRTTK